MGGYVCQCRRVWLVVVCACMRVYARRRVRMGACAYMRGYGTVSGGGMRLSDVGSCLVIVAWCNCCMCNYMSMVSRPGLDEVKDFIKRFYGVVVFFCGLWWFRHAGKH